VTDLKALAWELLHEAQQSLQEAGHLAPIVIVITPRENLIFDIDYEHEDDREEIYAQLVDTATDNNAIAIVTVNDIELDDLPNESPVTLEGPGWGALAQKPEEPSKAAEAVKIVVSGNGFETWSLTCPYFRQNSRIVFQPAREQPDAGAELELLGDWTGSTGNA
jgi:hypothetical protein